MIFITAIFVVGCSQNPLGDGNSQVDAGYDAGVTGDQGNTPPTSLIGSGADGEVSLSWTAVSGATSYNILRGPSAVALTQIATSATNSFSDTTAVNGSVYFYAIQSVGPGGTSGNSSNLQVAPLSTPTIISANVSDAGGANALVVNWSASVGASSYRVRYSTLAGSASSGSTGCSTAAPTATCTITGLVAGTTYYFSVEATNANLGAVISAELSGIPRLLPSLALTPLSQQITPLFSAVGATSYDLSYGTSSGSYSTTVTSAASGNAVAGLVNGTNYFFRVVAYFSNGSLSSIESSSSPNGPQYFNISSATAGNTQVALVWDVSPGATSYTVRYGTSSGSYPTVFASGVVGTTSTVTGLANQTPYYFMVTAVNANGTQDAAVEFVRTPAQPTLSAVADIATPTMGSNWSANMPFTLGGLGSFLCNGTVVATSSNTAFVANGALNLSGTYPNCVLNVAVGGGLTGATTITLTATYGSASAVDAFDFVVLPASTGTYSVRRLVRGFTGNALRVRRSSDNAEQNIGFLATGNLDTTALSAFCGATSCFVRTWFDQSGNGRDAAQTLTARQPRIVNAGTLETQNSRATVVALGTSSLITTLTLGQMVSGTSAATAGFSAAAVFRQSTVASSAIFSAEGSGQRLLCHATWSDNITYFDITNPTPGSGRVSGNIGGYSSLTQLTLLRNGTNQSVFKNGASSISTTITGTVPTTPNAANLVLLNNTSNAMPLTGSMSEVSFFSSALGATDRQALQNSQKAYFGTP